MSRGVSPMTHVRSRGCGQFAEPARSRAMAGSAAAVRTRVGHAVDAAQRLVDGVLVRLGGLLEQRPVDVEEQEGAVLAHRSNDPPRRCANAAMRRAHASTSPSWTISTGECM